MCREGCGVPGVAHPGGTAHRDLHLGTDPDRRVGLPDRKGGQLDGVELVEAAMVVDRLSSPQRSDDLHRLLESLSSSGAVYAEGIEFVLAVADPHSHDHPPAGHRIHGGHFLRNGEWMVQGQQQDAGGDFDSRELHGNRGQIRDGLEVAQRRGCKMLSGNHQVEPVIHGN